MSRIIIKNIPSKCTADEFLQLLEQNGITYNNPLRLLKSHSLVTKSSECKNSPSRYCVLRFDSDDSSQTAIELINSIQLVTEDAKFRLFAMPFISNFKAISQNSELNIVITNLPDDFLSSDLHQIFSAFGKMSSGVVMNRNGHNVGYILYQDIQSAKLAIQQANGRHIGPNVIKVSHFIPLEQRVQEGTTICLMTAGKAEDYSPELALTVLHSIYPELELEPGTAVRIKDDPRPAGINSGGASWSFKAVNKYIARAFIEHINSRGFVFTGLTQPCTACLQLSVGQRSALHQRQQQKNRQKFIASRASIQVFNLKFDVDDRDFRDFFEQFGDIKQLSWPQIADCRNDLFHFNVLYGSSGEADAAIAGAAQLECQLDNRLAQQGKTLVVLRYTCAISTRH